MATKKRGTKPAAQLEKTASAAKRAAGKATHENPLLPHKTLQEMHASMMTARQMERRAAPLLRKRRATSFTGREATFIGVLPHLLPQDRISTAPGEIMMRLLRGGAPREILRELRSAKARNTEENGVLPPVERMPERLAMAAGIAHAGKAAKNEGVVVAYLEPGEMEHDWLEILKTAARLELPIVFICLHGGDGKKAVRLRQWGQLRAVTRLKGGLELVPVIPVDGQDVVAMYRAAQESILRARMGIGPTVLWCEHWDLGPKQRDPLAEFESYLFSKGLSPRKRRSSQAIAV